MQVIVNGEPMTLADASSVADLLNQLTLTGRRIAVEVNLEIVPRSQHDQHRLREGDRVEVVGAIGGG
ncbi:sulfur carrier protein ThiS [Mangrovitalea sediminis]|uniref:sulfur carrier protein ThiS n=1 Tax=Mangrovitalea sediminis TaxID=1982043 RepID=UPI000BE58D53|nr:sulfur carrier protein ThiS [Mangrovitalea sediminis]